MKRGKNSDSVKKRKKKSSEDHAEEDTEHKEPEKGEKPSLDKGVVHVRSNGSAKEYVDYAMRHLEACVEGKEGPKVCLSGTGSAIRKTVAVVEMTKAAYAEKHAPHRLVQCSGTLNTVTIGDHATPRMEIVLTPD